MKVKSLDLTLDEPAKRLSTTLLIDELYFMPSLHSVQGISERNRARLMLLMPREPVLKARTALGISPVRCAIILVADYMQQVVEDTALRPVGH